MDKLTPSAQLTLDALATGPGNVHELSERIGRSRSTTDKAINELAKANLIVKVADGADPADGAPARWQLANPAPAGHEATKPATTDGDHATEPDTGTPGAAASSERQADSEPVAESQPESNSPATSGGGATSDEQATSDQDGKPGGDGQQAEAEPPKLCRGCQVQMPKICQDCWQKTPAYCGKCRRTMPQVRRGEPGEPVILANGLPKLRPGELEAMVEKVMREQPLPAFQGILGWTGGRVAIHLPGRSPGAITNAMRKFANAGKAELIGDDPERYKLIDAEQPEADTSGDSPQESSQTEAAKPAAAVKTQRTDIDT